MTRSEDDRDEQEAEQRGPTIRDKRRIDPQTYQVREPQTTAAPAPGGGTSLSPDEHLTSGDSASGPSDAAQEGSEVTELKAALAERTGDLQRLQAEYVNYKRRVDRDRDLSRNVAIEGVLRDLLPVLDDLRSAREHDELGGAFKAVADEVERVAGKYGLQTYGTQGDAFDPHVHEALLHAHVEGIDGPTCVEILQPGYRIRDKVLRPARVAVAEPAEPNNRPAAGSEFEAASDEPADQTGP